MTSLHDLLEAAAGSENTSFGSADVRDRVKGAQRRRRFGLVALVLVALVGGAGVLSSVSRDGGATVVAGEPDGTADRLRGRWVLSAVSARIQAGSRVQPVITFTDGQLDGHSGCGALDGGWTTESGRLVVVDLRAPTGECDASARSTADLVERVLLDEPAIGTLDGQPDSLKLIGRSGIYVAFQRDAALGTAMDPDRTGEVMRLPRGYELVTEAHSVVGPGVAPSQVRSQAWRDVATGDVIRVKRQVGGVPFSAKAITLLRPGARAQSVRGHPGVVEPARDAASLTWEESPSITLSIDASPGFDIAAVAEALVYDSGKVLASWASTPDRAKNRFRVAATGEVQDVPWQVHVYDSDSGVCIDVAIAAGSAGGCGHRDDTVTAGVFEFFGDRVVAGSASLEATQVRVEFEGGPEPSTIPTVTIDGYPRRYFGGTVSGSSPVRRVVAFDEDGREIGVVADLGGGSVG